MRKEEWYNQKPQKFLLRRIDPKVCDISVQCLKVLDARRPDIPLRIRARSHERVFLKYVRGVIVYLMLPSGRFPATLLARRDEPNRRLSTRFQRQPWRLTIARVALLAGDLSSIEMEAQRLLERRAMVRLWSQRKYDKSVS